MIPMQITTSADALSRPTYNALLYCPKDPPWSLCYVVLTSEGVSFLTCDGYALSWALLPCDVSDGVIGAAIRITRKDLEELEKRSREGKKEQVFLIFEPGKRLAYHGEDAEKDMSWDDLFEDADCLDDDVTRDEFNLSAFREIISERELDPQARQVLLSPRYLQQVGRTKRDKDQGADFWFGPEEDDTVLIKVGETHRLAIQPIDHERHRKALGEGATW